MSFAKLTSFGLMPVMEVVHGDDTDVLREQ